MWTKRFIAVRTIGVLLVMGFALASSIASAYVIGNAAPTSIFFVQGQSFTPGILGNLGSGSAPASGNVFLDSFVINYAPGATPFNNLYIYAVLPTAADASIGVGSLATGVDVGGGNYAFSSVALDVNTKYFAILPGSANIFDGAGDPYAGGIDIFPDPLNIAQLGEGGGFFDIGFSATFHVPLPATGALLLIGLAGMMVRNRKR